MYKLKYRKGVHNSCFVLEIVVIKTCSQNKDISSKFVGYEPT
jgi:hypothetical protein